MPSLRHNIGTGYRSNSAAEKISYADFLDNITVALAVTISTPKIFVAMPLLATLGFAVISFVRKEKFRVVSFVVFGLGLWTLVWSAGGPGSSPNSANLDAAEIVDWNWNRDPSFGGKGTIKWHVLVKNKSSRNIRDVRVEFKSFDKDGKFIACLSA